jgi:KaiC/GvpD/RAD55 family RecA-like ATPase
MNDFPVVGTDEFGIRQPRDYSDINRYLEDRKDTQLEPDWEIHSQFITAGGLGFRGTLEEESARLQALGSQYNYLVTKERMKPQEALRVLLHAARNLLPPEKVRRAVSREAALIQKPETERQYQIEANGERRRNGLEQAIRQRGSLVPVMFGMGELDALIPGGITAGEILHIVGGEGGLKTSLLLHILCDYVCRGGRALFFSLDMTQEAIELRRLMRLLNCGKLRTMEHIKNDSDEYRRARAFLGEQDENLTVIGGPLSLGQMQEAILMSGADVVGLDYVTLVEGLKSELETAREVTKAVRKWRQEWGVTFILLSQMSRESKRDALKGGSGGHGIGGSSLEQLVDYEIELLRDAPLTDGTAPRLIATLRKNRTGPSGVSFEIFPCFPSLAFTERADRVDRERKTKPLFSEYLNNKMV